MLNNISFKNLFFVKNVDRKNKNIQENIVTLDGTQLSVFIQIKKKLINVNKI